MSKNAIVVGGGLAGLAAAIYMARGGRRVTLFEKRRMLGGRAVTHRRKGFRFNLGPHALYRGGAGAAILRELGIPVIGGRPPSAGIAFHRGEMHRLPANPFSLLATSLLSAKAKMETVSVLIRIRRADPHALARLTLAQWLDTNVSDPVLRELLEALVRLTTYAHHPSIISAGAAIAQLQMALRRGVTYVHEGWQKIVDSMQSAAVAAGVTFVTSSRVVGVEHDQSVRAIEIGGLEEPLYDDTRSVNLEEVLERSRGTRLGAGTVLLAVDPITASSLLETDDGQRNEDLPQWNGRVPVTLACLDVALESLPVPRNTAAVGIDEPIYFSVHSQWAQIAPKGGALIHVAKYLSDARGAALDTGDEEDDKPRGSASTVESELEQVLDRLQPGWRDRVVHRRFLPNMVVANALPLASSGGLATRPSVDVPSIDGLYLAGDWVGETGMLADASLASARAAAQRILRG